MPNHHLQRWFGSLCLDAKRHKYNMITIPSSVQEDLPEEEGHWPCIRGCVCQTAAVRCGSLLSCKMNHPRGWSTASCHPSFLPHPSTPGDYMSLSGTYCLCLRLCSLKVSFMMGLLVALTLAKRMNWLCAQLVNAVLWSLQWS